MSLKQERISWVQVSKVKTSSFPASKRLDVQRRSAQSPSVYSLVIQSPSVQLSSV